MKSMIPHRRHQGRELTPFDAFNRFFDEPFFPLGNFPLIAGNNFSEMGYLPSLDVAETEDAIHVEADLPGYKPEDVNVTVKNGELTITGTMAEEKDEGKKTWHCRRCARGEFRHSFTLPSDVDEKSASCTLKNGKMKLTLPKLKKQEGPGTIPVTAA